MRLPLLLALAIASLAAGIGAPDSIAWAQGTPPLARFDSATVEFTYPPSLGYPIAMTVQACPLEDPGDKPDGVAPLHLAIVFQGARPVPPQNTEPCDFPNFDFAEIRIFSVAGYERVYPEAAKALAGLKPLIDGAALKPGAEIPYLPFVDAFPAVTEHVTRLAFPSGRGIAFLTQWMIEPDAIGDRLAYVFQGLSADGTIYVMAAFPVKARASLPPFPIPREERIEETYARYKPYAEGIARTLREAKNGEFDPDLDGILDLLRSLRLK